MSRAAVDPDLADTRRRLRAIYAERAVNDRWVGLRKLIVKWTSAPPLEPPAPIPPPAELAEAQTRLTTLYGARADTGRWRAVAQLLAEWVPTVERSARQALPLPIGGNVISFAERVARRRREASP